MPTDPSSPPGAPTSSASPRAESSKRRARPIAIDVRVPAEVPDYMVVVGPGLLAQLGAEVRRAAPSARRVALVTDANVHALYGEAAQQSLRASELTGFDVVVAPGERSKSLPTLQTVVDSMLSGGLTRRDVVVALGGGVVGDLAGLAAALFMRGVSFVQVPTTLLAQVDASIGGKVAIDLPAGKNLLGAFHFPRVVLADADTLATLPDAELACGMAEMLKHGLLFAPDHVAALIDAADSLYARDRETTARLTAVSIGLKAACVGRDPRETGDPAKGRALLNLGHTVGHALEHVAEGRLRHGEAVALGLRAVARVSAGRGAAPTSLEGQVVDCLQRLRLPSDLDGWLDELGIEALGRAMTADKKRGDTTLAYVGLRGVGDPMVISLTVSEILALLRS